VSQFALPALILITCEARRGEWVSLHLLIERLVTAGHHIERAAQQLVAENKLAHATHAGHPYWGIGVEGLLPHPLNQSNTENPDD
jgi:hypothetical protein